MFVHIRDLLIAALFSTAATSVIADEPLYRYEGNVVPYDKSAGWLDGGCDPPCSESVENGHFVLRWSQPADLANYHLWIATKDPPPPTLWVEWRFRSNHPIGPNFYTCDGKFTVSYAGIHEVVFMYGDMALSFSGGDFVSGLDLEELHTYRFQSLDGVNYTVSVDGRVFITSADDTPGASYLQLRGGGGCSGDFILNKVNEWDFVRFGTISYGERIIASDPPSGFLDAREHAGLDRFTVTFDSANYVYIHEITVETTGTDIPSVLQTRRRENDEPDTVEIVLDRPIPMGEATRLTFNDGVAVNVIEYTFAPGDTDGDGDVDLRDAAAFQNCFGTDTLSGPCAALDLIRNDTVDLPDYDRFQSLYTGP